MGVILFQSWDLLNWTDLLGIFLNVMDSKYVDLYTVKGKVVYKWCVKLDLRVNKVWRQRLGVDTMWTLRLGVDSGVKPVWIFFFASWSKRGLHLIKQDKYLWEQFGGTFSHTYFYFP